MVHKVLQFALLSASIFVLPLIVNADEEWSTGSVDIAQTEFEQVPTPEISAINSLSDAIPGSDSGVPIAATEPAYDLTPLSAELAPAQSPLPEPDSNTSPATEPGLAEVSTAAATAATAQPLLNQLEQEDYQEAYRVCTSPRLWEYGTLIEYRCDREATSRGCEACIRDGCGAWGRLEELLYDYDSPSPRGAECAVACMGIARAGCFKDT